MNNKVQKMEIEDIDAEFSQLFWAARKEQTKYKKEATGNEKAFLSAIEFAKSQGWEWAVTLLDVSMLERSGEHDKALAFLTKCEPLIPKQWRGLFYFLLGSALQKKGENDKAIDAYHKALDDPKYIKPGNAWNNIGIALSNKGEHEEAIKAYHKALDVPNYDMSGGVWCNIGNALYRKSKYGEAIKAYHKALDVPNYDMLGATWYNIGLALLEIFKYDEAIKAFFKAQDDPNFDKHVNTWTSIGEIYLIKNDSLKAKEAFEKALDSPDPIGHGHARARFQLQILKAKIKKEALSPDDRAMLEKDPTIVADDKVESGIIKEIQDAGDTQYEKYLIRKNSPQNDVLSILRGWCSAVTLLEGSERRWRGGGYFIKWRDYGIVIDPGFDFLRNFHDNAYHGREISAVVVSHNHPDHNSDLKDIDDLRYELFKRLASTSELGGHPYVILWDQDTSIATKFGIEQPQHQHEPIIMGSGFPQPIDLRTHAENIPVRLTPFKVSHGGDVPHAMGMVLELFNENGQCVIRIGYTGDTSYFPDLSKHLANCDLLIAHISQPSVEELRDITKLKDIHLGYRGTIKLLDECKPKLTLLAEFWAGFADLRIPLVKAVRKRTGLSAVLPAGLGMHLKLPQLEIICTQCGCATPFIDIKVAPSAEAFGNLAYLCPNCMIN